MKGRGDGAGGRRALVLGKPARRSLLPVITAVVVVAVLVRASPTVGAGLGTTTTGLLTLAIMLLAAAYAVRRRFLRLSLYIIRPFVEIRVLRPLRPLAVRLDKLRSWRVAHLALGVLCLLPLRWHVAAGRGGLLEQILLAVVALVIATGVLGVLLQYLIPQLLLGAIEREVRVRDVHEKQQALYVEAEERILGRISDLLVDTYVTKVKPILLGDTPRRRLLEATLRRQDPGALVRGHLWNLLDQLNEKEAETFRGLIDLAEEKVRLDLNLFQIQVTTAWLVWHDAAVACAGALVTLHVVSAFYFGGP
jgi:hypothetical protein